MGLDHWASRLRHCWRFSHHVKMRAMFFSSPLNHICGRMWMKHREIIELPVENKKNQIYLLFPAGETDKGTLIHKPVPVRSCRLGKGSDNTPRHCSSTGKGMTMRPSASWGKSLMKLLSLREKEKCITISPTFTFQLFFFVPAVWRPSFTVKNSLTLWSDIYCFLLQTSPGSTFSILSDSRASRLKMDLLVQKEAPCEQHFNLLLKYLTFMNEMGRSKCRGKCGVNV